MQDKTTVTLGINLTDSHDPRSGTNKDNNYTLPVMSDKSIRDIHCTHIISDTTKQSYICHETIAEYRHLQTLGLNPLIGILKPHSNGPSYSNMTIGTLAVDRWAVTFGTARRGLGGL